MTDNVIIQHHPESDLLEVILNRAGKKNALTQSMYQILLNAINQAEDANKPGSIILLRAEGDMFCAGNDLNELANFESMDTNSASEAFIYALSETCIPIIAAVNGRAIGVGATILLHCDFVVAAENAIINFPFVDLGIIPEAGSTLLLPARIGYQRAMRYVALGEWMPAKEAVDLGLFTTTCHGDDLLDRAMAMAMAQQVQAKPVIALRETKRLCKQGQTALLKKQIYDEMHSFGICLGNESSQLRIEKRLSNQGDKMNAEDPMDKMKTTDIDFMPKFDSLTDEQLQRKQRLAGAFRLFGQLGYDEGAAGHITVRDPLEPETFWVNGVGIAFKQIKVSDLIRVNEKGDIVEGSGFLNMAAFAIHANIHRARPDILAAAHAHSLYGKSWSALNRKLDPITQDACAFFEDHEVFDSYGGVVVDDDEARAIAKTLADNKACILRNHGLLTVGETLEAAVWWYIAMERSCQAQLLAEAAGNPHIIDDDNAKKTHAIVGNPLSGWFSFQTLHNAIVEEQPDLLD